MSELSARMRTVCRRAVERFGRNNQLWMLFEEFAELIIAICRYRRGRGNTDNIAEEIADCEIMLQQAKLIYQVENRTENWQAYKLDRLENLIEGKEVR